MMIMFNNKENGIQFFMIPFSNKFPKVKIVRNANNLIQIAVNANEHLDIEITSNLRDVLTLVIRSLLAKCPLASIVTSDELLKVTESQHIRSVSQVFTDPTMEIDADDNSEHKVNSAKNNMSVEEDKIKDSSDNPCSNEDTVEVEEVVEEVIEEVKNGDTSETQLKRESSQQEDQQVQMNQESKPNIKRQKLATGKKKSKTDSLKNINTGKENQTIQKESRNPFKDFFDNLGDKSKGFATSVMKERDEIFAKFQASKDLENTSPRSAIVDPRKPRYTEKQVQTEKIEEKSPVQEPSSDYLSDIMKVSQLSEELTKKNEYLEKASSKITKLKTEIIDFQSQVKSLSCEVLTLKDVVANYKEREDESAQEITDINNHVNFLQLENGMLLKHKQKFLKACPEGIEDLDTVKVLPKQKYKMLKKSYTQYVKLVKSQRILECKNMYLQVSHQFLMFRKCSVKLLIASTQVSL